MVYRLWRKRQLHYSSWQFTVPVPGAEFFDIARRHKMIGDDFIPTDDWNAYEFLDDSNKAEFNALYAKARRQQAIMAITAGDFEWRNWRGIVHQTGTMLFGKPNVRPQAAHGI